MKFNEERPFGVEIEMTGLTRTRLESLLVENGIPCQYEGYNHTTRNHWKIVFDGSIRGQHAYELVSPKLYGQAGLDEMKKVMKLVTQSGGRVNRSCGFHVHHSAEGLSGKQARMVGHFYSYFFEAFRGIFPLSRQNSSWAEVSHPNRFREMRGDYDMQNMSRYNAVNLTAIFRHGTIEFRQHQGTLNGNKAEAWVAFTQQFMLGALRAKKSFSSRRSGDAKELRRGLFSFWKLYEQSEEIDEVCERMLKFAAKRANWRVGKLIASRRQTPQATFTGTTHQVTVVIDNSRVEIQRARVFGGEGNVGYIAEAN